MWDDVGVFGNSDGSLLDVTSDHSDDDTGLFAFVDCFRDALFEWVLDSCQSQNYETIFVLFWMFVFGLFFGEFLVANEEGSERASSKLVEIVPQKILEFLINSLDLSILSNILGTFWQQKVRSSLAINVVLGVNVHNAGHSLSGRTERNCGYNLDYSKYYMVVVFLSDVSEIVTPLVCHLQQ